MMRALRFFGLMLFAMAASEPAWSCGTVPGWASNYDISRPDKDRFESLAMIHCVPVLKEQYSASMEEHRALAEMLDKALEDPDPCHRDLAVKNYFVFHQLFWLWGSEGHDNLRKRIMDRLDLPDSHVVEGGMPPFDYSPKEAYCAEAGRQIDRLRGRAYPCAEGECIPTGLKPLALQSQRVSAFIKKVDACEAPIASDDLEPDVVVVTFEGLNFRARGTTQSDILKELPAGALLKVIKNTRHGWLNVVDADCATGWVAGNSTRNARSLTAGQRVLPIDSGARDARHDDQRPFSPRLDLTHDGEIRPAFEEVNASIARMERELMYDHQALTHQLELYKESGCMDRSDDPGCNALKSQVFNRFHRLLDHLSERLPIIERSLSRISRSLGRMIKRIARRNSLESLEQSLSDQGPAARRPFPLPPPQAFQDPCRESWHERLREFASFLDTLDPHKRFRGLATAYLELNSERWGISKVLHAIAETKAEHEHNPFFSRTDHAMERASALVKALNRKTDMKKTRCYW